MKYFSLAILLLICAVPVHAAYIGSMLYVDGDLDSGNNDGGADATDPTDPTDSDNWTDAFRGAAGLQSAFDAGSYSISFTSGSTEPTAGQTITGAASGATCRPHTWVVSSGTWGGGDAAGKIYFSQSAGTPFQSEACDVDGAGDDLTCSGAEAIDGNLTIYIRDTFTIVAQIDKDTNQQPGPYWFYVVGCNGTSGPIALGSYVTLDSSGTDLNGNSVVYNTSIDHTAYSGIRFYDPSGGNTPGTGENCYSSNSSAEGVIFENCKFERGYYGCQATLGAALINCEAIDSRVYQVYLSHSAKIIGGHYEWGTEFADGTIFTSGGIGTTIIGAVFEGGTNGAYITGSNGSLVMNCAFIGQSSVGLLLNSASNACVVLNNIFDVDATASDYAMQVTGGRVWENYNRTDADTQSLAGQHDWSSSAYNLTFVNDDPFISISGDNFRLNRGQSEADNCFGGGTSLWWDSSTATISTFIGPAIAYDLPEIENVETDDTVYGTTGTASGGGGANGIPSASQIGGVMQD